MIVPAGIARLGPKEYNIQLNSSPRLVEQFNDLPVGVREGVPVSLGDVAKVSDSFAQQTNIVRINGQRASFLPILKNSTASTIAVVDAVKAMLPDIQASAPEGMELKMDFDQSVFVRAAVENVVKEAMLSSILVVADDPGVPRQLAEHGGGGDLDPAVDLRRHRRPVPRPGRPST